MRAETEKLAGDLNELNRVTNSIASEREKLKERVARQLAEKKRLSLLIDEKQKLEFRSNASLAEERKKAEDLASRAQTLRELIVSLQTQIEGIRETAAAARSAEAQRLEKARKNAESNSASDRQIASITVFSNMRGKIALPVTGSIKGHFGDPDSVGGQLNGNTVQTQSRAIVTAPSDGLVLYAGPFRSYGQLLILDAGDGYHVILAGMDRISVGPGQSVVAGEPVGIMGDHRLASSVVIDDSDTAPSLYIELRKDGRPIDPAPWWAPGNPGRTGNDT
jgi:septal ring factor EnvC (AmiA/AmiB activator)